MHPLDVARLPPVETTNIGSSISVSSAPIALVRSQLYCAERLVTASAVEAIRTAARRRRQLHL